jgi:hypothetical protein
MKRSILTVFLSITLLASLTGCSQQVKLKTGVMNSATIKSCAYDITMSTETTGNMNSISEEGGVSSILNAGKVSLNFNGKMLKEKDRSKISSNIRVSSAGVSFETPVHIDSSNTKLDFDMFIGVPDILKSLLGDKLANTTNLHLASKDLESYVKNNNSDEEYQKFQDSMTNVIAGKDNKNTQVSIDILATVNSYLDKNKKKVQTFEKLGNESASKNGIYTIKLSKDDIKAIVSNYIGNKKYFSNYKDAIKEAQGVSLAGAVDKAKSENLDDATVVIEKFNKELDAIKAINIISTFTIEEKLITKTNIKFDINNTDGNVMFEIDSKLSDVNKVTSIVAPNTSAENTLNIMEFIEPLTK